MFGIDDPSIYLGYLLAIMSLLACVIYGIVNWNKGSDPEPTDLQKDAEWAEEEEIINEQL